MDGILRKNSKYVSDRSGSVFQSSTGRTPCTRWIRTLNSSGESYDRKKKVAITNRKNKACLERQTGSVLVYGYGVFYHEPDRMAMGGLSSSDFGRMFCEPGFPSWTVAADLWIRERVDPDPASQAAQEASAGVPCDRPSVRLYRV